MSKVERNQHGSSHKIVSSALKAASDGVLVAIAAHTQNRSQAKLEIDLPNAAEELL